MRRFLLLATMLMACDRTSPAPAEVSGGASAAEVSSTSTPQARAEAVCTEHLARLATLDALPGAPGFEAKRIEILGRAKGEAVAWVRAPEGEQNLGLRLELLRSQMGKKSPMMAIPPVVEQLRHAPEDLRRLLLPEGYVYSESPEVATVLIDVLKLGRLFRERELWLARGGEVMRVERDSTGVYRRADGERQGDEAVLLLGDRVATQRDALFPLLHRDLGLVVDSHAPDRVRLVRQTSEGAIAALRYGEDEVMAALDDDGQRYRVRCVGPAGARADAIAAVRRANAQRARSMARVREAIGAMVDERLRFDEPLEEVGQQDGSLRPLWLWAYHHDASVYRFNDVTYQVFDPRGRAQPPQVCVDFVLDAYERASGRWFRGATDARERTPGAIDFEAMGLRNRRSAAEVVTFASAHPEAFEVWNLPDDERTPFGRRAEFFRYVDAHADRLPPGAIVVIHGRKDDGLVHYHSFLVESLDPLTGFPYRLAGNAGRPRLQSWEGVMRSAPARSLRHVLVPRAAWLEAMVPPSREGLAERGATTP